MKPDILASYTASSPLKHRISEAQRHQKRKSYDKTGAAGDACFSRCISRSPWAAVMFVRRANDWPAASSAQSLDLAMKPRDRIMSIIGEPRPPESGMLHEQARTKNNKPPLSAPRTPWSGLLDRLGIHLSTAVASTRASCEYTSAVGQCCLRKTDVPPSRLAIDTPRPDSQPRRNSGSQSEAREQDQESASTLQGARTRQTPENSKQPLPWRCPGEPEDRVRTAEG